MYEINWFLSKFMTSITVKLCETDRFFVERDRLATELENDTNGRFKFYSRPRNTTIDASLKS